MVEFIVIIIATSLSHLNGVLYPALLTMSRAGYNKDL